MIADKVKDRVASLLAEMLAGAAPNMRKHLRKAREPARLARLADLLPVAMIAILQPPGGVPPDRLDVSGRIGGKKHVCVGGRHGERSKAFYLAGAERRPGGGHITKTAAAALAPDGQFGRRHVGQPRPGQQFQG